MTQASRTAHLYIKTAKRLPRHTTLKLVHRYRKPENRKRLYGGILAGSGYIAGTAFAVAKGHPLPMAAAEAGQMVMTAAGIALEASVPVKMIAATCHITWASQRENAMPFADAKSKMVATLHRVGLSGMMGAGAASAASDGMATVA